VSSPKNIMRDMRVIAAIDALKRAVLAVNGDAAILGEIILFDIVTGEGTQGRSILQMNICSCPTCLKRTTGMLNEEFEEAKRRRQAGEGRVVH
jgi:hypothetical protein